MADKFEREIEEILAKLDDQLPSANPGERPPISIAAKRQQKAKAQRVRTPRTRQFPNLNPTNLLFAGAGIMLVGLVASNFWSPAIWASLAGIVLFIGAFVWSFRKTNRPAAVRQSTRHYWRDRWIDDTPTGPSKGWFRRK